ncbi:hypothetical protein CcaCcLH18_01254 [Colletotrichum camelliae]|nr:hypothetical protein CcaCcLH18_01254 [Colletotrichum camelliae]
MANMNIPAPVGLIADNDEDVGPEAARPTDNDVGHGASVLRRFIEDLEKSEDGAKEVDTFRHWIDSMVDDGIKERLDMKDRHGRTLLNVAAIEGLAETAKRLIDAGAFLDSRDEWGDTPLMDACGEGDGEGGYIEVVKLLLEKGAKADIFGYEKESPLYRAAIKGHGLIVQHLLAKVKWDLDIGEETSNMTPLHAAASGDDSEMVRYLREKGARLDIYDSDGWTPLMTAIASQRKGAMIELLQRRNNEDIQLEKADSKGRTPILRAAEDGFWDGFRLLMEAGAKWTETAEDAERDSASSMSRKDAALHFAISENEYEVVQFLLEQGADVNSRGQTGRQPLHLASLQGNKAILKLLFDTGNCNHLNTSDDEGMTPLHLACKAKGDDRRYNEVVRLLLDQKPRPDTELMASDGQTALEVAFASGHDERGLAILGVLDHQSLQVSDTLKWAAGETERHDIVAYLLKRRLKMLLDIPTAKSSKDWTAIEWAAYAGEPQVLWLLIASSPDSNDTRDLLKSAKALVEKSKRQRKSSVNDPENQETNQTGGTKKGRKDINRHEIEGILNDPPIDWMFRDSSTYSVLKCEDEHSSNNYYATIVQFYKEQGKSKRPIRSQTIKEIIYGKGLAEMMEKTARKSKEPAGSHSEALEESGPKFTWVHLPATNIVWMNHLLQRVMDDENEPADVESKRKKKTDDQKFEEEKRFDYMNKLRETRAKYQKSLDAYSGKIHGSSTLDESYYHFGADDDSSRERDTRNESQVATGCWLEERDRLNKRVQEKQEQQEGKQDNQPRRGPKLEKRRQHDQEKSDQSRKVQETDLYWLLIRVNQLWIWTINDRFLISASSHPIDDGEDELLNGILAHLEKQRKVAESKSQPDSIAEMSQLIVDYCVETYERKPAAHDGERPDDCKLEDFPSIRQTFSKSINSIARGETKLFERFSKLRKRLRKSSRGITRNNGGVSEPAEDVDLDKDLADATLDAEDLSRKVKDILDELSMLEATVQHQQDVQKAMRKTEIQKTNTKCDVLGTDLTATYILNDIKKLDSIAQRAQDAINTTPSIHQSEIANLQAGLANLQAGLAMQEGRVLMVFTVVTTLFLPMSFLTSLFALDVASFQQAPPWALVVICVSLINIKTPTY